MMDDEDRTDRRDAELRLKKLAAMREQHGHPEEGLAARQDALHVVLNALGERLEVLERALQPVLRERDGLEVLEHATPQMETSPLAGFLHGATEHAADLGTRVAHLIDRVDL